MIVAKVGELNERQNVSKLAVLAMYNGMRSRVPLFETPLSPFINTFTLIECDRHIHRRPKVPR
jgi:hypothetical protein